ncbi:glycosyltransferase family 4 protein [Chamaesiphon sp. OTE_8_metabat_110]|uniref:glycosyltransferase family 4 protein n=1 Tax=Chamaesiphon sp. OTE_8_metabat_110 TaxID=2964696 RepID=UPI00286BB052|nr:glycosyltransferase family 4 protein [Chamaesiphon sp. OTE_8_metabat_110]
MAQQLITSNLRYYMPHISSDILNQWQAESRTLIPQHFAEFQQLVERARSLARQRKFEAAASYVEIAAQYAQFNHGGFFTSPELEQILIEIGRQEIPSHLYPQQQPPAGNPQRILHVSTNISTFSGIPRMIRRWIQQDTKRSHSLALTLQAPQEVPQLLQEAIAKSNGRIHILNQASDRILDRARKLRECAAQADIIVTHAWEYDAVPLVAFADKDRMPPSIYTNHGDHWFWLGAGTSDVVANLRESGRYLSQHRRGIAPERNMLLPIALEPMHRSLSRAAAKQHLGIAPDTVLLLSIARPPKYKTIGDINFAQAHVPLLQEHPQAMLTIVGAGDLDEDWSEAIAQTNGRIQVLKPTDRTAEFYQAADIYVDSFPVPSTTSLLEAGSYGTPLFSRNPYPLATCQIFGQDTPGLAGQAIEPSDLPTYLAALSQAIADEAYRLSLGAATQHQIAHTHWGQNWLDTLEKIYCQAASLPRVKAAESQTEQCLGELDALLCSHASLGRANFQQVAQWHLPLMPLPQRWELWLSLVERYGWRGNQLNMLASSRWRDRYYQMRAKFAAVTGI